MARSILDESMSYVRSAKKQGRIIGKSQSARFSLAEMAMYLDVMKAVTYHRLNVEKLADGYEVSVIFDV